MIDEKLLKNEEKAIFNLRSLYRKYGYCAYKMSKFEEYELYIRNKDFLVSDRIITFNDTNGKLMALKPDVTLSIIKSSESTEGTMKVYYNENVYRVSESTHQYKEIMQAGLECIGSVDLYQIYEVISLAAESLAQISPDFILEISNLDFLSKVLNKACGDKRFEEKALFYIEKKDEHDLEKLCAEYGVDKDSQAAVKSLVKAYGKRQDVLDAIKGVCDSDVIDTMAALSKLLETSPYSDKIVFDFSVVNNMNYYNGFVFNGFISGICDTVLAGGQYEKMMKKLNNNKGAIGFALYLDLLEELKTERPKYDINTLILYDDNIDNSRIVGEVNRLIAEGLTVSAQKSIPEKLRFKEILDLRKE